MDGDVSAFMIFPFKVEGDCTSLGAVSPVIDCVVNCGCRIPTSLVVSDIWLGASDTSSATLFTGFLLSIDVPFVRVRDGL